MDAQSLKTINAERRARRAAVLLTDLDAGSDRVVREADATALEGGIGEAVRKAFRTGVSTAVNADGRTHFLNVYMPRPRLVVIGAVHISQALAPIAKLAGYDVTIVDPRTAFATPERFPDVSLLAEWPENALPRLSIDRYTAFVALTHDPKIDDFGLVEALRNECFYVGALGSKKTHARRVERLRAQGLSEAAIARIHAPIGLDIGAVSPAEIAVAVMAEITTARRRPEAAS